jgi:hypothetical protein
VFGHSLSLSRNDSDKSRETNFAAETEPEALGASGSMF